MPAQALEEELHLLDACCIINLLATGRMEEILEILPFRFATSRLVATREVLAIARDADEGVPVEREVISPRVLGNAKNLSLLDLSTEQELTDFVRFAAHLDDGEASVCALALSQGGGVATDDLKALRVLSREAPGVFTAQTPELLHDWAHLSNASAPVIARVLRSIERRARFRPRRNAPRFEWWSSFQSLL
jgi:hypothetical protein